MKDKIKPIDVSIISTYMGRSLTAAIAVFVVAVTIAALVSGGGAERNIIEVCVSTGRTESYTLRAYEPFRVLLSGETRRPVVLDACKGEWSPGYDLYILPMDEYFRHAERQGIEPLYELRDNERHDDDAVLVSRPSQANRDYSTVKLDDVVFATPRSVNRFWVQMSMLSRGGFEAPASNEQLRFEGTQGDGSRVVFGVLHGAYRLGACKLSDLTNLTERGILRGGELEVLDKAGALPEVVIAVPHDEAAYYRRKLTAIASLLDDISSPAAWNETVELLRSRGVVALRPIDSAKIERTRRLFERYSDLASR
jgi:hypothetical protein